jgi:hypothetical protein
MTIVGCQSERPPSQELVKVRAIQLAIEEMISLSSSVKGHVKLTERPRVVKAEQVDKDPGWHIVLRSGTCEHLIYVDPGRELENTGASAGCFSR